MTFWPLGLFPRLPLSPDDGPTRRTARETTAGTSLSVRTIGRQMAAPARAPRGFGFAETEIQNPLGSLFQRSSIYSSSCCRPDCRIYSAIIHLLNINTVLARTCLSSFGSLGSQATLPDAACAEAIYSSERLRTADFGGSCGSASTVVPLL
jgi:hypothetical protein